MPLTPPSGGIPQCFAHARPSPRPPQISASMGGRHPRPPPIPTSSSLPWRCCRDRAERSRALVNNSTHPHGDIKYTRCMNTGIPLTAKGRVRGEEKEGGEEEDEERERDEKGDREKEYEEKERERERKKIGRAHV